MQMLMQFQGDASEPDWFALNDSVMGGQSLGTVVLSAGELQFTGALSLANNGGFSSIRTRGHRVDLTGVQDVVLRVLGDGRNYQIRLATDARFQGMPVSYGATFPTVAGEWSVVRVGLHTLTPSARGSQLDGPPLDPSRIREIGFLIGDKREGAFSLTVDWIGVE